MTDDDARSLLAAYALDAVDDDERRAVEDLVARDAAAAAELDDLRAVTAAIAATDEVAPPTTVRASVLEEVARTQQETVGVGDRLGAGDGRGATDRSGTADRLSGDDAPAVDDRSRAEEPATSRSADASAGTEPARSAPTPDGSVVPLRPRRSRRTAAWGLAAAAAVVVGVAVPGVVAWQQYDRAAQAQARADLLTELLTEPGATVLAGALTGGGEAVAVLTAARGAVVVDGLPELDGDRVYQVWAMRDGVPVPAGFLDARSGSAAEVLTDYRPGDGVALSVEPEGGSAQPTTTPLVVLVPA